MNQKRISEVAEDERQVERLEIIPIFSEKAASSKSEVGGGRFGSPDRVEIFVASATKSLVRKLKGRKSLKSRDLEMFLTSLGSLQHHSETDEQE